MAFISIIIPTYNRSASLLRAIDSVHKNSESDIEIIVVDDGSNDGTAEEVKKLSDSRIRYHRQENKGVCAARNKGAELSGGQYLIFLDSDDEMMSGAIDSYREVIRKSLADILFADMMLLDGSNGKETFVSARSPYGNVKSNGIFIPGTFCISKKLFDKAGAYDNMMTYGENTDLKFRVEKLKPSIAFVDTVAILYHQSIDGGSKNIQNMVASNKYMLEKHKDIFERFPALEKKYRQTIAIAQCRMGEFTEAKRQMWSAYKCMPSDMKTLARLILFSIPFVARKIWH